MLINRLRYLKSEYYVSLPGHFKWVLTIFIVFQINSVSCVLGQTNDLRFTYINTNNGLSNNTISCIMQDDLGFMWIGTMDGLNRYDGFNIKSFKKTLGDTNSLIDNLIYDVYIDHKKQIWIGTQAGLCKYNLDYENFNRYILDKERINLNTANRITGILENSKKQLFASSEIGTLYRLDRKTNKFLPDTNNFQSIKKMVIDSDDNFWLGGIYGLNYYNTTTGKIKHFEYYREKNVKFPISEVNTVFLEGDTIWIGTVQGRIYYILRKTLEVHLLKYNFDNTYYIFDIYKGKDGLLYIGTTNALFIYDKKKESCISYTYEKDNPTGLSAAGITKIYEDRQGNFWVGTSQGGINLALTGKKFHNYNTFSKQVKLDFNNINCVYEDRNSNIWLGSYDQGINLLDFQSGKRKLFLHNPKNPRSICFGTVNIIFEDSRNNYWIGTYVGPLQKLDLKTNSFISYNFPYEKSNPRFGFDVRSIIEDENGILWIIPHGSGLISFDPTTGKSKNYRFDPNNPKKSLADDWAFQLIMDYKKTIWIATPSGLSHFNPSTEEFNNLYHDEKDSNSLCNNFINVILEDSYHNLWIGTSFGLDLFDRDNNRFIHFYENNGLPSNQIKSIIEYRPGQLWLGTTYGLSQMDYVYNNSSGIISAKFRNYDKSDNIQDFVFLNRSVCKTKDNNLIFGGENGIVMFKPEEIVDNKELPQVYLTNIKINNQSLAIGDYDSILTKCITHTKEIELKYNQNFITFEFIAINFIAREKNKFKYKLEGFDEDWIEAGTKREATYTNIDPGEYYFKVIASNNDDYWNNEGISIKLIINPPFWATWWFRISAVLFITGLTLWYYYNRIKNYKEQNILLEKKVEVRTFELKELNKELTNKNIWISAQNKEITEQYREINNKSEEIMVQKELLEEQKMEVEKAYDELTKYRSKLEEIVEERTRELIIAKEKAEESDRLKSSFLANMSHEIRTPLNSIIGFSNIIIEEQLTDDERDNFKQIIGNSCNSLLKLINDIIDFSKIEAGHLEIYIEDIPVKNVLNEIRDIYNLEIGNLPFEEDQAQIDFIVNVDEQLSSLVLSTDEHRLKQILSILLNNALKFTASGFIEVGCRKTIDSNSIEFFVKDTGIGISKENHKIIFQRFRKADDDKSNQFRGAGLGLSIAQHLVNLLGGEIYVESEVGRGTTFYFTIPLKDDANSTATMPKLKNSFLNSPDLSGKLILVAEDDPSNYAYLERLLKKANSNILHANDGIEVISLIKENPGIALILMDIKMPKVNGFEAFEELKTLGISIPVIAQTAYAYSSDIQKIKKLGFDDYISKPINPGKLYELLTKYIDTGNNSNI